jgi:hypothetical protein
MKHLSCCLHPSRELGEPPIFDQERGYRTSRQECKGKQGGIMHTVAFYLRSADAGSTP